MEKRAKIILKLLLPTLISAICCALHGLFLVDAESVLGLVANWGLFVVGTLSGAQAFTQFFRFLRFYDQSVVDAHDWM